MIGDFKEMPRSKPRDRGATMVEYGLIVAAIAVVVAVVAQVFGSSLSSLFSTFVSSI